MFYRVFSHSLILSFFVLISITASAFEWRLNDMWICGDSPFTTCDDFPALDPFFDDFEDGERLVAPTSSLIDFAGSNVTESGGYLVFDSSDGGIEIDLGDGSTPYIRDEVFVSTLVPDNTGDGFTVFAAQFDSDISQLSVGGIDPTTLLANDTSSGFGITFAGYLDGSGATGRQGAQLGVFTSIYGCQAVFFNDLNPHWIAAGLGLYGYDVIGGGPDCITDNPITGDIILRLELLQDTQANPLLSANNYLRPSYSVDGGETYITYDQWDSATVFGTSYLIPISYKSSPPGEEPVVYDGAVATVFGQTATTQLQEEEFVPMPVWALISLAGMFVLLYKIKKQYKTISYK